MQIDLVLQAVAVLDTQLGDDILILVGRVLDYRALFVAQS